MAKRGSLTGALLHRNYRRVRECEILLAWLDPRPGERILDVGCGDGYYSSRIADSGASVTGIDIHERRLSAAARRTGPGRPTFLFMDAERMDLPEGSFDAAVSLCVIEHFREDELVLRHIHRVLRPEGRLVFSADSLSIPGIRGEERERHRARYGVNTFYTPEIVHDKLDRAGFTMERAVYHLTTPLTLALARLSWRLDDLPGWLVPLRALGHLALGTVGVGISNASERRGGRDDCGMTLLVQAKKRGS